MPALVIFKHRTLLGGDDLRVCAGMGLVLRVAQLAMSITLLVLSATELGNYQDLEDDIGETTGCLDKQEEKALAYTVYFYLIFSVMIAVVAAIQEYIIWVISGRGSPTEPEKRTKLQCICQTNLTVMMAWKLVMIGIGAYVLHTITEFCECSQVRSCDRVIYQTFFVLIITHAIEIVIHLLAVLYFGCKRMPNLPRSLDSETKWRLCCRLCCTFSSLLTCCLMGGREAMNGDFTDIAMLLSDFFDFHGTLDVVPSDIVAGMLMVKRVQKERVIDCSKLVLDRAKELRENTAVDEEDNHGELDKAAVEINTRDSLTAVVYRLKRYTDRQCYWEATVTRLLTRERELDSMAIAEGARYMRLSLAIYTWMMYTFNRPCTGLCEVVCLSASHVCNKVKQYPGDRKFCRLHAAAFMKEAGVEETEVAYAQFRYGVTECPYAIVIDHDWQSIVIVIRGTLSLEDMLTDLTLRPTCLDKLGETHGFDGDQRYAHAGMLVSSEWIFSDMAEKGVLSKLLNDAESKFSKYQLRITGHSLGAGCAAILAIMLRPKYPNLLCHCFSPPGCTLSENAAAECEEYLTSYVLDSDLIPRSSLTGLENLRYDIVDMISRIKVPKTEIVCGFNRKYKYENAKAANAQVLHAEDETPDSDLKQQWCKFNELYKDRKNERAIEYALPDVELFPPGKFVHLMKTSSDAEPRSWSKKTSQTNKVEYVARWAHRLDFREIRISSKCIVDHSGMNVLKRLEAEARRMKLPATFVPVPSRTNDTATDYAPGEQGETAI
mmetsp:Transcript_8893/g.14815  ORF Transcript_8893/g.14815 Transcript_8893/m.14815 type:complete len:775 (-) Transcript_8893:48-2372(-)|eukprot:CAMPEP_0119025710 /NCGR_PEP_ID=MMETSP1176-20130426/34181_1 /TAXON_ID=265551 /ORGANISM="Synedropsis recta cf, Strain CCMP1620" /LENGTH=774 /DNA_ID=CAMNT_0006981287 /DNA_START=12 /DNA_END=2336 /DNA_ORIENTATION=+